MHTLRNAALAYIKNKIFTGRPMDRLLMTYDLALAACHKQDKDRACAAIHSLIDTLQFHHDTELPIGLYSLYKYCIERISAGDFQETASIIKELRDTWEQADKGRSAE